MSMMNENDPRKQEKKRVSRKYLSLFLLMLVWGILIIAKMAFVMFGERQYWNDVERNMTPVNRVIVPKRGNILSDDGLLLASSMKQYRRIKRMIFKRQVLRFCLYTGNVLRQFSF